MHAMVCSQVDSQLYIQCKRHSDRSRGNETPCYNFLNNIPNFASLFPSDHSLLPSVYMELSPINPLKVLSHQGLSRLSTPISDKNNFTEPASGFLTIDQNRSVVLLKGSDSQLKDFTLAGV